MCISWEWKDKAKYLQPSHSLQCWPVLLDWGYERVDLRSPMRTSSENLFKLDKGKIFTRFLEPGSPGDPDTISNCLNVIQSIVLTQFIPIILLLSANHQQMRSSLTFCSYVRCCWSFSRLANNKVNSSHLFLCCGITLVLTSYFRGKKMFSDMAEVSISLTLNFMGNFF